MSCRAWLLGVVLLCPAPLAGWAAAPPAELTAAQKAKLSQRDALLKQVGELAQKRQHDKVVDALERIAAMNKEVLGETHGQVVSSLQLLAAWREFLGQDREATRVRREVLELQQKRLGEEHWEVTDARLALRHGRLLAGLGDAERQQVRQADIWNQQVFDLWQQGKSKEALPLAQKALQARRAILGEKHPHTALSWLNLGAQYAALHRSDQALMCYRQALRLRKEVPGPQHPDYADSLNNLAGFYQELGEHGKALPLLLEARELYRKVLGEKHPRYANSLNWLAGLYRGIGEHGKALPLFLEAQNLFRKVLGEKHPAYARSLNNLASLYKEMGEHKKALPLFLQALALRRTMLGPKHPDYAQSLDNLASLYQAMGEHDKALPLFLEARDIVREVLGKRHPDYARSLNNLAVLYQAMGEHQKALPLLLQARDLDLKVLGDKHPNYATSLNNLAALYHALGEQKKALALSRQALAVLERYLEDGFDHLGEVQRAHLTGSVLYNLWVVLSLQEQAGLPLAQAYDSVLAWKGRVAARGILDRLLRDRPELKGPLARLQSVRGRLARLGLQTPEPRRHAAWLKELQSLADEKVSLESDLARLSADARRLQQRRGLTAAQVSRDLPPDVAFVDLLEYGSQTPPAEGKGKWRWELRLLAFVVRRGQQPVAVPLGAWKPVAAAVARWRKEVEKPATQADRKAMTQAGQELRQRVWLPLVKHLGGAKTVVVAPDGVLCQFPLPALPGEKAGSFLLEEIGIAQVSSAQQMLELLQPAQKPREPARGLLAVGGVDYGAGKVYPPLPGTATEAERCRSLFRRAFAKEPAAVLSGKAASVAAVRQTLAEKKPRFLHLATHGFFEPPGRVERLLRGVAARRDGLALWREQTVTLADLPLLRCGLVLAGANQAQADGTDGLRGVLSGEDVEGLDLRGCELAVLSACQTALGDVKQSQGVLGLQRAFHAAGARTLVTSLWSVSDAATVELMEEFYSRLWGKERFSRLEALRQAQLAVLRHPERVQKRAEVLLADAKKRGLPVELLRGIGKKAVALPVGGKEADVPKRSPEAWWAAFVLSGDWR